METVFLDLNGVHELYRQGYFDADATLDTQTSLLIWDCHDLGLKNCRSLILDAKRGVIISDKESTRLVNQFIKRQPVGLLLARCLISPLAKKPPCLPYVWGKILLVPLSGYTRHPTSWLRLDHVDYNYFVDPTHIAIIFDHDPKTRFILPINKKTYLCNLKTTATIYYRLRQLIHELSSAFDLTTKTTPLYYLDEQLERTFSLATLFDDYLLMIISLIYHEHGITTENEAKLIKDHLRQKYDHL